MEFILVKDKVTKNNKVRYADDHGHNLYLTPGEVKELGSPDSITVTVK